MKDEVTIQANYSQFKQQFDEELRKSAEGFVRIGYLLKVARDTQILYESGYRSEAEFAKAEYGLSKDQVSRFIRINDRFSENGYSERLAEQYEAYGVSKLAEMLTLPDTLIEAISPDMSKAQIQEIRKEVREEEKVTDIEVMLEPKEEDADNLLEQVMRKYLYEHVEQLRRLKQAGCIKEMVEVLAPSGVSAIMVRISGRGKIAWIMKGQNEPVELVDVRGDEKEAYTWQDVADIVEKLEIREQTEEVAPAQPQTEVQQSKNVDFTICGANCEQNVQNNVDNVEQSTENVDFTICEDDAEEEEKLEGQMAIEDYKEVLPDGYEVAPVQQEKPTLDREMLGCARNAFENLKYRMKNKAYKAALTDARHLVHYLEAAGVEDEK